MTKNNKIICITLSIEEAAKYSGIGQNRLRSMVKEPGCPFAMHIGSHTRIKKKELEEFISYANAV